MNGIHFFMCFISSTVVSLFAENLESSSSSKGTSTEFRNPRVSSEFGYSIQNTDRESSHFRQEQRDPSGVVRGSYGFKDPNGGFRLVQYVADDKGFRAHISSNENGVGRQNPASVSINRFEHQPEIDFQESNFKTPISLSRRQNVAHEIIKTEAQLNRYDYYSPLQDRFNYKMNGNRNFEPSSVDNIELHRTLPVRRTYQAMPQLNPVDKLIRTRFGVPDEMSIAMRNGEGVRHPVWETVPTSSSPFEQTYAQESSGDLDRTVQINRGHNTNHFPNYLHIPQILSKGHSPDTESRTHKNEFKNSNSKHSQFLSSLHPGLHHKVHTSLPDCKSTSSAELCGPPILLSASFTQRNSTRKASKRFGEQLGTSAFRIFLPKDKPESLNKPKLSNIYDFYNRPDKISLPHLMPNSYPLRSDIYTDFYDHKSEHGRIAGEDQDCNKQNIYPDGTNFEDYFAPSSTKQKFSNDDGMKEFKSFNVNENQMSTTPNLESLSSQNEKKSHEAEYYSSLVKIIQNDHSLSKLKNLLMKAAQSSTDLLSSTQAPKLNLLGILILPSHIVNELNNNHFDYPTEKTTEHFDEKNMSLFGDDIFESDIVDETETALDENRSKDQNIFNTNVATKDNESFNIPTALRNETGQHVFSELSKESEASQHGIVNATKASMSLKNSQFHVFNDAAPFPKDNGKVIKELYHESNASSENWRRILEEEISREYQRTSLQQQTQFPDISPDALPVPETETKQNQGQYSLNKHSVPLFDSTGRPIRPENVPIHIHRYIPPTGIPSLPWKFSIPRPAPPRSIVVPPKPPHLS